MYKELKKNESFSDTFSTWIIAYCLDTDSFFCTNQRFFWWEYDKEFETEDLAIQYFTTHISEFRKIRNEFADKYGGIRKDDFLFLYNTREKWN